MASRSEAWVKLEGHSAVYVECMYNAYRFSKIAGVLGE